METENWWSKLQLETRKSSSKDEFFKYFDEVAASSPEDLRKELGVRDNWRIEIWGDPKDFIQFLENQSWLEEAVERRDNDPDSIERTFFDKGDFIMLRLHGRGKGSTSDSYETTLHNYGRNADNVPATENALKEAILMMREYLSDKNLKARIGTQAQNRETDQYRFLDIEMGEEES